MILFYGKDSLLYCASTRPFTAQPPRRYLFLRSYRALAFWDLTQGSAKPTPWAKFCYAYGVNEMLHTCYLLFSLYHLSFVICHAPRSLSAICYLLFAICYLLFVMRFAPSCASPSYSGNVLSETNTPVAFSGMLSVTFPAVPDLVLSLTISRIRSKMIASKINPPRNELAK
jgi:hypothetical protein